jgi:hypothetical protein
MGIAALVLMAGLMSAQGPTAKPELPVLKAGLGTCSADFTVKDADGAPVYLAMIKVRVRYGFANVKRMDLEVGTNSDGQARIEGLPKKAQPLAYDIQKEMKKATAEQDLASRCEAMFDIALK